MNTKNTKEELKIFDDLEFTIAAKKIIDTSHISTFAGDVLEELINRFKLKSAQIEKLEKELAEIKAKDKKSFDIDNWCIRMTRNDKERAAIIGYLNNRFGSRLIGFDGCYYGVKNGAVKLNTSAPFTTEITFEQFLEMIKNDSI